MNQTPWCIEESLFSKGPINHRDLLENTCGLQNQYRKAVQIYSANVCGVLSLLLKGRKDYLFRVALAYDRIIIERTSTSCINSRDWEICFKSDCNVKSYFRQVEATSLFDPSKTLVVARTDATLVALLLSESLDGTMECETILEQTSSKIQDIALQNTGALIFAVLRTKRILEIWDLAKDVEEPVMVINLRSLVGQSTDAERLFTNLDESMVLECLAESSLEAIREFSKESLMSVAWQDENSVLLAGCQIWRLLLKRRILIKLFPPSIKDGRLNTHFDSTHRKDFAFSCITQHPHRSWLLFAFSATYHEAFLLDIRTQPLLPLCHLPLPDVYSTRAIHKSVRWISGELIKATQREGDGGPPIRKHEHVLLIPPFREAATGGLLHSYYFIIPSLRLGKPSIGLSENPFSFSLDTYSQWTSRSHQRISAIVGNLEYRAWVCKRLNLKTRMFKIDLRDPLTTNNTTPLPATKLSTNSVLKKIFAQTKATHGDEDMESCAVTNSSSLGGLYALDVLSLRNSEKSWNSSSQSDLEPSPLILARPQCTCAAVKGAALDPQIEQQFQYDPREIDEIGPMEGTVRLIADGKNVLACATKIAIPGRPSIRGAIGPSSPDHDRSEEPEGGIDILDMLMDSSDILSQNQLSERSLVQRIEPDSSARLCGHYSKYCLCIAQGKAADLDVAMETGDDPPIKMSIKGLGLPINKHLINALLAAWPAPSEADSLRSRNLRSLMIANVSGAKAQHQARPESVQDLLGATQEESGVNWFDTFGEDGDGGGDAGGGDEEE